MSDLSAFGGGIDQPDTDDTTDEQSESRYKYSAGRCRGIKKTSGERCRGSASEGELCFYHDQDDDPVTIDYDPITLIEWTSRTFFEDLDELDVDHERIRGALHNVHGLEDEPLPVYDEGIWLPQRYAEAGQLILRTPTATIDSRLSGSSRDRIFEAVRPGHWDPDYLDGEGRTAKIRNGECLPDEGLPRVGIKIAGGEQRWHPIKIVASQSQDDADPDATSGAGARDGGEDSAE